MKRSGVGFCVEVGVAITLEQVDCFSQVKDVYCSPIYQMQDKNFVSLTVIFSCGNRYLPFAVGCSPSVSVCFSFGKYCQMICF